MAMPPAFTLPSFAKINWLLRVLGRRDDGFHELFTVLQMVSLHDELSFTESDELTLTCDDRSVPTDQRNLILKAAKALRAASGVKHGAAIELTKRIPSPGGLGGGSSNAAIALVGLARLWNLQLPAERLHDISTNLGSDVPFFLTGGTAVGTARGEMLEQIEEIEEKYLLIVTPNVTVPTAEAYAGLDAASLTSQELNRILRVCRLDANSLDLRQSVLINDFERTVFARHPEIEKAKNALIDLGAANAALCGSGASVFAIFDKEETRQAAEKALEEHSTWRKFAVSTVSRSEYREALRC